MMESIQQIHIQLKSRNGDIFLVDPTILQYSGVLQARLDELWASEKDGNVIMVPEGDSNLLKMIIDWLRSRKEDQCSIPPSPEIAIADSSSTIAANQEHEDLNDGRIPGIGQWEADYFNGNKGSIFTLLAVANRLEVATLLKDAGWALLKWCRNKSLDETYETFGIRNPMEKTNRGGESAGPGPESTAIPETAETDECDRNTMPQRDVEVENIDETPKTNVDTMPAGAEKAKDGESPESDAYDAEMISDSECANTAVGSMPAKTIDTETGEASESPMVDDAALTPETEFETAKVGECSTIGAEPNPPTGGSGTASVPPTADTEHGTSVEEEGTPKPSIDDDDAMDIDIIELE